MNTKRIVVLLTLLLTPFFTVLAQKTDGLFAEINTSKGKIVLQLEFEKTPITVANFVALVEGKNTSVDEKLKGKPFYNGLKFHRVISDFMIQGGDPDGTGSGGPGYKFIDEISDLIHDKAGILSMANAGAGTNGSQFFITHKETPWLDGKHTVFGHVIEGQDVVNAIVQNDIIENITIIKNGKAAKKFKAEKIFKNYMDNKEAEDKRITALNNENKEKITAIQEANRKKQAEIEAQKRKELEEKLVVMNKEKAAYFTANKEKAIKLASGLEYIITEKGNNTKPTDGAQVYVHYSGYFEDGKLFDSSYEEVSKKYGKFDQNRASQKGYLPFPFKYGSKGGLIPGFLEGIHNMSLGDKAIVFIPSSLGYGEKGAGGVIPPNANLIFEIELLETQSK
ncbi:peptidylprolyl isomerase [Flavobacterium sediminilitoris]|uniref:peptidylprolyl isomerase n=1 Tax=Flavobacterium sediminilitoris TaxID=2024526 RepID=A0ABY4HNB3_9FLAO|nr:MULTISPECIES: peptidylprolyl isomerase [Flavobacterium]UOX33827.1 peptidylprolyl isomerase [Flavobacterium sediminilitoris]